MRNLGTISVVMFAAFAAALATETPDSIEYDVVAVKRNLLLVTPDGEQQLHEGDHARSGDLLRTGSRSAADLEAAEFAAMFHVDAKTRFRLAHDRPGVLIDVERGSLRGVFGKLTEGDDRERLVTTPSAVLAVRGTDYGVDVEKDGDTTVTVFEGTVEVRGRGVEVEAVQVRAGHATRIRRDRAPTAPSPHGLSADDWDRGKRNEVSNRGGGQTIPGAAGDSQKGGGNSGSRSTHGGSKRHGG